MLFGRFFLKNNCVCLFCSCCCCCCCCCYCFCCYEWCFFIIIFFIIDASKTRIFATFVETSMFVFQFSIILKEKNPLNIEKTMISVLVLLNWLKLLILMLVHLNRLFANLCLKWRNVNGFWKLTQNLFTMEMIQQRYFFSFSNRIELLLFCLLTLLVCLFFKTFFFFKNNL